MPTDCQDLIDRVEADAAKPMPPREYLSAKEAAEFIGFSLVQLAEWRCRQSGGPAFLKIGRRVAYRVADLRAFMDAHLVKEGTGHAVR